MIYIHRNSSVASDYLAANQMTYVKQIVKWVIVHKLRSTWFVNVMKMKSQTIERKLIFDVAPFFQNWTNRTNQNLNFYFVIWLCPWLLIDFLLFFKDTWRTVEFSSFFLRKARMVKDKGIFLGSQFRKHLIKGDLLSARLSISFFIFIRSYSSYWMSWNSSFWLEYF